MRVIEASIPQLSNLYKNNEEELLFDLYFSIKNCDSGLLRREMVLDYNILVRIINHKDPLKGYREIVTT